ncbi:tellurite resistance TerB family protein [Salinarimonas sp. NSM]|uniref:tellurite resistance TerB family protein n=1 Tax=Salinarimonas sp. NSM TaxID=3458003 RepID=UPI0040358F26
MDARRMLSTLTDALGRTTRRTLGGAQAGAQALAGRSEEAAPGPLIDVSRVDADEALFLVRTMIAAASADGVVDASERARLHTAMREAGIDSDDRSFLDEEIAWPRDIEEIADAVSTPEQAARTYAAARLVIEPDTMQERAFLRLLAERMDLKPDEVAAIEARAGGTPPGRPLTA